MSFPIPVPIPVIFTITIFVDFPVNMSLNAPATIIPGLYPKRGKPRKIGQWESFVISGMAPAIAVIFTNPFDTAKVRLQLQGQSKNSVVVLYR